MFCACLVDGDLPSLLSHEANRTSRHRAVIGARRMAILRFRILERSSVSRLPDFICANLRNLCCFSSSRDSSVPTAGVRDPRLAPGAKFLRRYAAEIGLVGRMVPRYFIPDAALRVSGQRSNGCVVFAGFATQWVLGSGTNVAFAPNVFCGPSWIGTPVTIIPGGGSPIIKSFGPNLPA
jgi:hypothetical protein